MVRINIEYASDRDILIALVSQQAQMVEDIGEIKVQTTITNGRVNSLEATRIENKSFKRGIWVTIVVAATVLSAIIGFWIGVNYY